MPILRWLPSALLFAALLAWLAHGPVHQFADYHAFADRRVLFGLPNASDVLSNLAIAAAGAWGLWCFRTPPARAALGAAWPGYALFFAALVLTALGSGYYHLAPDNARIVWDRLPIALACAGLLAGARADTIARAQSPAVAVALALAAAASVFWWRLTDARGSDDLGPYLLFQLLPLLFIPAWQSLVRAPRYERLAFAAAIACYALAKAAEVADARILEATGAVSGHTLKHLLAAAAAFALVSIPVRRRA